MNPQAAAALERLRAVALTLPEADEKLSHGMPAFFITPAISRRVHLDRRSADWDRIADRVAISWELVAPRRLLEAGGR